MMVRFYPRHCGRVPDRQQKGLGSIHVQLKPYTAPRSLVPLPVVDPRGGFSGAIFPDHTPHAPLIGLLFGWGGMPNCASSGTAAVARVKAVSTLIVVGGKREKPDY